MAWREYPDDFKRMAIQELAAAGYPEDESVLKPVAARLGVHFKTLKRWFKGEGGAPPPPDEQTAAVIDLLDEEIRGVLGAMAEARAWASYRELGDVLKILIDKQQVLSGAPTDRTVIKFDGDQLSDNQRMERVVELLDLARTRRTQSTRGDFVGENATD